MREEPQPVTTPCPRCGRAIAWAVYTRGGVEALEVADQPCPCDLTRDEWADLAEHAEEFWIAREREP